MFEKDDIKRLDLGGVSYPYVCDLVVLEMLQNEYGDLTEVNYGLRGFVPYKDENGVPDLSKEGTVVTPNVTMVAKAMAAMINEGIEVTGEELDPVTELDMKRQDDWTVFELSAFAWTAFDRSFVPKNRRRPTKSATKTRKSTG